MTEKRFTQKDEDDWEILDRNKHFAYAHSGYQAEKIIQELNELVETNRELYKENKKLKKENEQLKQSNQKLNDELQETMGYLALKSGVEKENEQLRKQLKHIQGTIAIINGYLQDDGVLTFEKYREIEDYRYKQWSKGDVE